MAIHITKKCPHCGCAYYRGGESSLLEYGSPLKTCSACGQYFWDNDIKEPALYGFGNAFEKKKKAKEIAVILFYGPMGLLLVGVSLGLMISEGKISLPAIGLMVFGGAVIGIIVSYFVKKREEKLQREQLVIKQRRLYDESKERLQNTYYLTALASHDRAAQKLLQQREAGAVEQYGARP